MNAPYRILIWGPGGLGSVCIREIVARPEFQLVGALAFSDSKNGADLGEIAGIGTLGITATTDIDEALAIDCDCVIHASRDFGIYNSGDELVKILDAGRNVVTVHAYHLPEVMELTAAPPDLADRIHAACETGNSTFHCTGIHPEFVCNRLAGTLSGLVSEIRSITVSENWDACHISREQLEPLGFGATPEAAAQMPAAKMFADNYALMNLHTLARALGVTYTSVETDHEHVPAPEDMPTFPNGMTVSQGQVGRLTHRYTGHVDEPNAGFPVTVEVNWMVGRDLMCPDHITTDDYYIVTIEGRPSVRLGLNLQGSWENDEHFVIPGDSSSEPGYYATVMTLLHAVPRICTAEPGWIDMIRPAQHWRADLREHAALT